MVVSKIFGAGKSTLETLRGLAVVIASPNAPIPESKVNPRLPPRASTPAELFRLLSWRHTWLYVPILRTWVFAAGIVAGVALFVIPMKPRTLIAYHEGKKNMIKHERDHWYGLEQRTNDALYFKKYNPLPNPNEPAVGGH